MTKLQKVLNAACAVVILAVPFVSFAQSAAAPAAPTFWQQVAPELAQLAIAALALLTAFVKFGGPQLIKTHTQAGALQTGLLFLSDTISALVTAAEQQTVSHLRKALADGKITRSEFDAALKDIAQDVKDEAFAATIGRLKSSLGWSDAEARAQIEARVEAAVPHAKATVAASKAGPRAAPANP